MRRLRNLLFAAGWVLGLASAVLAQSGGMIDGRVLDPNGKPLRDAAVLLYGTSQMGSRVYITGPEGAFHFTSLPAGTYRLRVELPGRKTRVWENVALGLGQTIEWNPVLEPAPSGETAPEEETKVLRPSPTIDVRNPAFVTRIDALLLASLPTNRDLYDFQNAVPGAVTEDKEFLRTSSILGGTVRSQVYKVDGALFNDPVDSTAMDNLDVDTIEAIEFEQAGHPAESGPAGGTTLNIITKTGGRLTTAGLAAYLGGTDLDKVLVSEDLIRQAGRPPVDRYSSYGDFSFSLGGPVLEDIVWATLSARRLAWNRTNPFTPETRMEAIGLFSPHYDLSYRDWMGFFRFTLQYSRDLRYSGQVSYTNLYEPVDFASAAANASEEYTSILDHGYLFFTVHNLNYVIDPTTVVDVRGSYSYKNLPVMTRDANQYSSYDFSQDIWFGSAPFNDEQNRRRIDGTASITKFLDGFLGGSHELKAAFEFEQSEGIRDWNKTNPYITYWYDYATRNPYYFSPAGRQGRLTISTCQPASGLWEPLDGIRRFAGYVQDSLRVGRLALNLGATLDYSSLYQNPESRGQITPTVGPELLAPDLDPTGFLLALSKEMTNEGLIFPLSAANLNGKTLASFFTVSPRFGLVFDIFGTNRTAFKASAARYYEPFWIGLYDYDQVFAPNTLDYRWNDVNGNGLMDMPSIDRYDLVHYPNQSNASSSYASDLKAPYTDELRVGLEQELWPDFKVGLSFLYRVDKNIIDTFDIKNGYDATATDAEGLIWIPFTFTDPGLDGTFATADDQTLTVYGLRRDRPDPELVIGNIPDAKREYKAAIFTFEKRLSHGWELQGSFIYSSFKGNIGAGTTDTDFLDLAFNSPNTLVNGYGSLFFDRPLQFHLMGSWILPWGVVVSANFEAYSGIPWNRTLRRVYFPTGFAADVGGVKTLYAYVNAESPGAHRYEPFVNLDLHLEKGFSIGGRGRITLLADVFNVLGRNGVTLYEDPAAVLDYRYGTVTYTPSASYGQVSSIFGVRSVRLGLRIGV
jgi:hypothetical protein